MIHFRDNGRGFSSGFAPGLPEPEPGKMLSRETVDDAARTLASFARDADELRTFFDMVGFEVIPDEVPC